MPVTYKQVAAAFEDGRLSFDELLASVHALPPPEENPPAPPGRTLDQLYQEAELSPRYPDNSTYWLLRLADFDLISDDQADQLVEAAIGNKMTQN